MDQLIDLIHVKPIEKHVGAKFRGGITGVVDVVVW